MPREPFWSSRHPEGHQSFQTISLHYEIDALGSISELKREKERERERERERGREREIKRKRHGERKKERERERERERKRGPFT